MNEYANSPGNMYNNRKSNFYKYEEASLDKQLKRINTTDGKDIIDVDYYVTNLSKILEKKNINLNSRMFLDNLVNTLDSLLSEGHKFNRALFTHILDFGNHKKDSVILL
jgi:hypothetical protein